MLKVLKAGVAATASAAAAHPCRCPCIPIPRRAAGSSGAAPLGTCGLFGEWARRAGGVPPVAIPVHLLQDGCQQRVALLEFLPAVDAARDICGHVETGDQTGTEESDIDISVW